jgi:hypothetical protein
VTVLGLSKHAALLAAALVLLSSYALPSVYATTTDCAFTLSPNSVTPGSDNFAVFSLTNNSASTISSVVFTSPDSLRFTILSSSAYQWQSTTTSAQASFSGGSLSPGGTLNFTVEFSSANTATNGPLQWSAQASSDPSGANATTCSGDGSMSIASQPSQIAISNVGVIAITDHETTIEWTTDVASTSQIQYGLQTSYGQSTSLDTTLVTDHVAVITNLQASTIYHYQVTSTTPDGGTATQGDNTLLTAVSPKGVYMSPNTVIPAPTITPNHTSPIPILKSPTETIAPTVLITSKLPGITKSFPVVSGIAQDNVAVARIDFSLDNGQTWLVATTTAGLGTQQASFSFTVDHLDDANYSLVVRAIDTSGNIGKTSPFIVVIDRLPPIFSNLTTTFGSQTIEPTADGTLQLAANGTYRVTGQAVGGPILINILAHSGKGKPQSYSLSQDSQSGLWYGSMSFTRAGTYFLSIHAKDGAGNITDRQLGSVQVAPPGRITNTTQQPLKQAKLTVYYMEPSTKQWVVWDGAPYSQSNPQLVTHGSYTAMIPAGQYYLKASAVGYRTAISERFTVTRPQSINQSFRLTHTGIISFCGLTIGLPTWANVVKVMPFAKADNKSKSALTGNSLPAFSLPTLDGGSQQKVDLFGKPTDITLLDTWSPGGVDQLSILASLQRNQDIGIVPVFEGQSAQSAHAYVELSNLKLGGLADTDNSLAESLQAGIGPRHIFVDRSGHIKKVMVGVLSEEEILHNLGGM